MARILAKLRLYNKIYAKMNNCGTASGTRGVLSLAMAIIKFVLEVKLWNMCINFGDII